MLDRLLSHLLSIDGLPFARGLAVLLVCCLDAIEVSTQVVLVQIALLYVICHLTLALACLLRILELEAVLVHGEAHGLEKVRYFGLQNFGHIDHKELTLTLSSCSAKHATIRSWNASVGSRVA